MLTTPTQNRKFLIFTLHCSRYALNLAQIAEVGDPPRMSPIPLAPSYYSGALAFHGDIVAVINLAAFLGMTEIGQPGKIIILNTRVASLAFLVGAIVRIVSEEEVSFSPAPTRDFITETLVLPDGDALQLDLTSLTLEAEKCLQKRQ